ncbi:PTS sugar transporter subunit IIA [Legionella spiritensis]|uniref:Nitrogen regulatory protein n=1 Tax=Legionella spiritensis TaxID=452 RepID=A0A0W0Z9V0_LEGSP|nr:PTS sugar transporter subunit IIA [Legionella spiritensis]KTD65901.1 Nitrogen regulatory protein [Legionella spiritensis]SNV31949.1 Nitrogen regulatory protein [Legionella spiritensis]
MHLRDYLSRNCVRIDRTSHSKTGVLLKISQMLAEDNDGLNVDELFEAYWRRETLGSTSIGCGVILPHVRCSKTKTAKTCVIRLIHPVDFGAEDKQPADLVVGLLIPETAPEQHLKILSAILKQVSCPVFRNACRQATSHDELYRILTEDITEPSAA